MTRAIAKDTAASSFARNDQYLDPAHVHAPTHIGGRQIAWYDANGNMTQQGELSGTTWLTHTQAWDVNNRKPESTDTNGYAPAAAPVPDKRHPAVFDVRSRHPFIRSYPLTPAPP